jgi:branched-chain amino acid transport system ATP-binding protein
MKEKPGNFLVVDKISKHFGGFAAVSKLTFGLDAGEIVGLVGPNGAGKTTIFNLLTGFLRTSEGRVIFKGKNITNLQAYEIARMGLVRTFQLNRVFASLSVRENLEIGCHGNEKGGIKRFFFNNSVGELEYFRERVDRIAATVGLTDMQKKSADNLSYGDQKLLGIGIALGASPDLLLLDEPFSGMNSSEAMRCVSSLRRIVEHGTTIFLIDHNMRAIMGFCDRIIVVNFGEKIADGKPGEICKNNDVISCYLGGTDYAAA